VQVRSRFGEEGNQLKRREFITLLGGAAASWSIAVLAHPAKLPTIGSVSARTKRRS
jgi:hypothetical protein